MSAVAGRVCGRAGGSRVQPEPTAIPGVTLLRLGHHVDARGDFVKAFQRSVYEAAGLDPTLAEVYWSTSHRGVIRGLHLQVPPFEHAKTDARRNSWSTASARSGVRLNNSA